MKELTSVLKEYEMIRVSVDNDSLNIVDDNNVVLGFETGYSCCESTSLSVYREGEVLLNLDCEEVNDEDISRLSSVISKYSFDPSYYVLSTSDDGGCEDDKMTFKVVADGLPDLFIAIENNHNGYYGHGFDFCKGEIVIVKGVL